jgi:dTMP kinase
VLVNPPWCTTSPKCSYPANGPIGRLCCELTETITGHALACLYAADRYHHIDTEIRPHLETGTTVITDRYIPSGLVIQRFDGVDPVFLWQLNAQADRPDLAVILEADPAVIAQRLADRGPHNRFQQTPGNSHAEVHFYQQATDQLTQAGFNVLPVDCNQRAPQHVAALIHDSLNTLFATAPGDRP